MRDSNFSEGGTEMGLRAAEDTESRFVAYVEGLPECDRSCGPGRTAAGLLHGFGDAVRSQERGADGGGDGAGASWRRSISRCCISLARRHWSDERVLAKVREMVLPAIERPWTD